MIHGMRGGLVAMAMLSGMAFAANAAEVRQPSGVVELFTSQGCSSCPPADKVLSDLAKSGDTLALAWHVDYWDYLGWKDTFSSAEFTKRQRAYARSLGERQIYTPQAVINGRMHVVGSRGEAVRSMLAQFAGKAEGLTVPVDAVVDGDMLKVHIPLGGEASGATLWMVYFNNSSQVDIKRGELAGQKLTYTNIVRDIELIGTVKDRDLMTEFRLKDMQNRGYDSCALILQHVTAQGTPGPIVGAAFLRNIGS